jgi:hypothetical protein
MSEGDSAAVEWIIANTINKTARGDPDALADRIVAALAEAGYSIVPANLAPSGGLARCWKFVRLSAGGKWIRTLSTRKISYRFETDFCRLRDAQGSRRRAAASHRAVHLVSPWS